MWEPVWLVRVLQVNRLGSRWRIYESGSVNRVGIRTMIGSFKEPARPCSAAISSEAVAA
jgi:hypothetical protein